jgi:4-diphosphocytidyl-2-C-methyl-D-erythritol kinase
MKQRAYAKINLALNLINRREDGYHNLDTIMVPIDFYDVVDIEISDHDELISNEEYLKNNPNTLVKAANIIRERYNIKDPLKITIEKKIPTQAGLGGGSSDGAAVIRIMNKLFDLDMSYQEKTEIARMIGADVAFTLFKRPALATGLGDELEFFPLNLDFEIVLVKPRGGVSTRECFANIDYDKLIHPDCELIKNAAINGDYQIFIDNLGNSLEETAFRLEPNVKKVKDLLMQFPFDKVLMSGSGSTVFGITQNQQLVTEAVTYFRKKGYFARKAKVVRKKENI